MSMRSRAASAGAAIGVALALLASAGNVHGQTLQKEWTAPRTPDGQPDLQGVWLSKSATPLERPRRSRDERS